MTAELPPYRADYEPIRRRGHLGSIREPTTQLGARLRELRIKAGLTQEELGKMLSEKDLRIGRLETGRHVPQLQTLEAYGRVFGMTVSQLLEGIM